MLAASAALARFHVDFAWVVIVGNGLTGAWALAADRFVVLRHRALWWAIWLAWTTVFVQVAMGVALVQGRPTEPYRFHMFYGFVAAFTVAIIFSYRSQLAAHRYRLYGFGGLFLMGLGLRALAVGPH